MGRGDPQQNGKEMQRQGLFDIVLPLKVQKHWQLIIWEFDNRMVRIDGFRKEVDQLSLDMLSKLYSKLWKVAAMEGIKTLSSSYHEEKKAPWKLSTIFISRQAGKLRS